MKRMIKGNLVFYLMMLSLGFCVFSTLSAQTTEQSGICTSDGKDISADDWCKMLKEATANGAKQIIMVNGQCFGGGFSCVTAIGTSSNIFVKYASQDTEVAWHPGWAPPLRGGFSILSTVYSADTYATGQDATAPGGFWFGTVVTTGGVARSIGEHPGGAYSSGNAGAQAATLTSASSLHAVLFAGSTTGLGNDCQELNNWYAMLTTMGYPPGNITLICPGTRAQLQAALSAVSSQMNSDESLFVMIYDHGTRMAVDTTPKTVVSIATVTFTLPTTFRDWFRLSDTFPRLILSSVNTTTTQWNGSVDDISFTPQPLGTFIVPTSVTPVRTDNYFNVYNGQIPINPRFQITNGGTVPIEFISMTLTGGQIPRPTVGFDQETSNATIPPGTNLFPPNYLRFGFTGASIREYQSSAGKTLRILRYDTIPPNPIQLTVLPHFWNISTTSSGDIQCKVCLDYDPNEVISHGMNENTMYIGKSDNGGSTWTNLATDRNTFIHRLCTSGPVSSFSLFAIGDAGAVPVGISNFQSKQTEDTQNGGWKTLE